MKRRRRNHDVVMRWLRDLLCGALIGAGAILPGVSGGLLAVAFDIYRPFMEILTHPKTAVPRYWGRFLPVAAGWGIGFLGFAKGITAALELSGTVTAWLFIGLIAGTMPQLFREAGKEGRPSGAWNSLLICAFVAFAGLYRVTYVAIVKAEPNFWWYSFCGVLWGMGIVIPGMTASSVMMALGLYEPVMEGLASLDFRVLSGALPGMFLAVVLLARGVNRLFQTCYAVAFHGILGIVIASTLVMIPVDCGGMREAWLSGAFCIGGFLMAFAMERLDEQIGK